MRTQTPARSREQRLVALEKANAVRMERVATKRAVKSGSRSVAEVIVDPMEHEAGMKVMAVLLAQPNWGVVKVEAALRRVSASSAKTVAGLSLRQQAALLVVLGEGEPDAR